MANNAANVTTGKPKVGGAIYVGATTATLPTAADAKRIQSGRKNCRKYFLLGKAIIRAFSAGGL